MSSSPVSQQTSKPQNDSAVQPRKTSKTMNIKVIFLDNTSHVFQVPSKALAQQLFDKVCKYLNLLEVDYFGLEYTDDKNTKYWLDALKPMCRQTSMPVSNLSMHFCVKFYTPDPVQLEDEYTRYLFSLQIKQDLAAGLLQCNDNTAALMVSYIIQADHGDYDDEQSENFFLSSNKFLPYQDADLQRKISENHRKLIGQTPAEADLNLLETARRCELYGIRMTSAKDHEGVPLNLAVAHLGVLVFQNFTKINTFSWAKIRKLSFKRKRFLIKLHPEGYGYYKDTVEFFFEGRNECKNFWKKCIENHTFFRCTDAKAGMRQKPKIFSRGSSFRYSGRTQKQVSDFVRENYIKRQPFQRSTSLRTPSSPSHTVGFSVSAQPLLPITASVSCGSMADAAPGLSPPKNKMSASEPTTPHVIQEIKSLTNRDVGEEKPAGEEKQSQVSSVMETDEVTKVTECVTSHVDTKKTSPNPSEREVTESVTSNVDSNKNCPDLSERNNNLPPKLTKSSPEMCLEESLHSAGKYTVNDETEATVVKNDLCDNLLDETISEHRTCVKSSEKKFTEVQNSVIATDKGYLLDNAINPRDQSSDFDGSCTTPSQGLDENISPVSVNGVQSFSYNVLNAYSLPSVSESRFLNHKRTPSDKAYCIAKELLMSERTYRRDLEILNVVFRDEFNKQGNMPSEAVEILFSVVDPLYEVHCLLLRELEQQMAIWEGKNRPVKSVKNFDRSTEKILYDYSYMAKLYDTYVVKLPHMLELLFDTLNSNQRFSNFYQKFEMHKTCYLPLTSFLLRPLHRIFYYSSILQSLMHYYGKDHANYKICEDALNKLQEREIKDDTLVYSVVNYVKLAEVQRNLVGFENIFKNERAFIREGCLQKLSETGNQQKMFFLFSDILLYAVWSPATQLHFEVQDQLSIQDLKVQPLDSMFGTSHCFSICGDGKTILLAASSEKEKLKWLNDLCETITTVRHKGMESECISLFSDGHHKSEDLEESNSENDEKFVSNILNTAMHVCWHRNISIGRHDLVLAAKHSLSGYLLRKFKNNVGWQKLWVVLSNLCIFFYKTHLDDCPLANLPLAGYKLTIPSVEDPIGTKDFVFKLQYKSHSYFFQAENQYCFDRWMEMINLSTLQDH